MLENDNHLNVVADYLDLMPPLLDNLKKFDGDGNLHPVTITHVMKTVPTKWKTIDQLSGRLPDE